MVTTPSATPTKEKDERVECVGTLLVHTSDLQELTDHKSNPKDSSCSSSSPVDKASAADSSPTVMGNLRKRLTKDFQDPPRYDQEEADFWMDD